MKKSTWRSKCAKFRSKCANFGSKFVKLTLSCLKVISISVAITAILTVSLTAAFTIGPMVHPLYLKSKVGPHTYKVFNNKKFKSGGTGFAIQGKSGTSYILTNAHICDMSKSGILYVKAPGKRPIRRKILENSDVTDLCLLEGMPGNPHLKLASSHSPSEGITSIGHPLLMPLTIRSGVTLGRTDVKFITKLRPAWRECRRAKEKRIKIKNFFGDRVLACQIIIKAYNTDIEIYPGNSGSPVVNKWGNIVGVIFATNGMTHWGSMIPLNDIKTFLASY